MFKKQLNIAISPPANTYDISAHSFTIFDESLVRRMLPKVTMVDDRFNGQES